MAVKYCRGAVPERGEAADIDCGLIDRGESLAAALEDSFHGLQFHRALATIWELVNAANKYIVESEPWLLAKDDVASGRLREVMYNICESIRIIAVAIGPFMPDTSAEILRRLGVEGEPALEDMRRWGGLRPGSPLDRGEALFPRREFEQKEEESAQVGLVNLKDLVDLEAFQKLDIRAAQILEARAVPKTSKLIELTVDVGEERTIVAGIGEDYRAEELVGKQIAVIVNLKPAKIRGIESRGMLLAATGSKKVTLVGFDGDVEPGTPVG